MREKPAKLDAQWDILLRHTLRNLTTSKVGDHLCVNMSAFLNFTARDHAIKGDHLNLVITLINLLRRYGLCLSNYYADAVSG